jgi:DNA-binding NtrC family response regulator
MTPRERLDEARQLRAQADEIEAEAVRDALRETGGNVARAATLLGMLRSTLDRLLRSGRLAELDDHAAHQRGRPAMQQLRRS